MARPVSEKTFANMLRVALKAAHAEGGDKLRIIADQLVEKAMGGDLQAVKEIADRLDGKPSQQVELIGDPDSPITTITRIELVAPGYDSGSDPSPS